LVGRTRVRRALVLGFFRAPATPEMCPLSLHDALPIYRAEVLEEGAPGVDAGLEAGEDGIDDAGGAVHDVEGRVEALALLALGVEDRKSTRLNSSHVKISYAVFCLKKKNTVHQQGTHEA